MVVHCTQNFHWKVCGWLARNWQLNMACLVQMSWSMHQWLAPPWRSPASVGKLLSPKLSIRSHLVAWGWDLERLSHKRGTGTLFSSELTTIRLISFDSYTPDREAKKIMKLDPKSEPLPSSLRSIVILIQQISCSVWYYMWAWHYRSHLVSFTIGISYFLDSFVAAAESGERLSGVSECPFRTEQKCHFQNWCKKFLL